jgi:hypothetical protein
MAIERVESGFFEWHTSFKLLENRPGLGLESHRLQECVDYFNSKPMSGWFGSPNWGFHGSDLNFLTMTPQASWIWFWDIMLTDINAIYELPNLDYLGILPKRPGIDFSRLPHLKLAVSHWNRKDSGFESAIIDQFDFWHFKPKEKTFTSDCVPRKVSQLRLYWANPESLAGLPVMENLNQIEIHRCRNLSSLKNLPEVAPNLESLLVTSSGKCKADEGVMEHPSLMSAYLNNKVVLNKYNAK